MLATDMVHGQELEGDMGHAMADAKAHRARVEVRVLKGVGVCRPGGRRSVVGCGGVRHFQQKRC